VKVNPKGRNVDRIIMQTKNYNVTEMSKKLKYGRKIIMQSSQPSIKMHLLLGPERCCQSGRVSET